MPDRFGSERNPGIGPETPDTPREYRPRSAVRIFPQGGYVAFGGTELLRRPPCPPDPEAISGPQRRRLWALIRRHGVDEGELRAWLVLEFGIESTKAIRLGDYTRVVEWVQGRRKWPETASRE